MNFIKREKQKRIRLHKKKVKGEEEELGRIIIVSIKLENFDMK